MVSKKYVKDFEVEYDATPGGRLKARAVYKGKFYVFTETDEIIKKTAKLFAVLIAVAWAALLVPLLFVSSAARTSYVIFPHVCLFLPLLAMSAVTVDLWTAKPPLTREKSEHISQRAPKSAFFMLFFSGVAAIGFVVALFLKPDMMLPGDLVFGLCEIVMLAASSLLFVRRGRTATREAESPKS